MAKEPTQCSMVENWLSKHGVVYPMGYYVVMEFIKDMK